MSIFRLFFAGEIKKVEFREAGGKPLASVSLCRKNRGKTEPETFTWVSVNIWGPFPDWMVPKLVKGSFIAGSGEFTLRSYEKDGQKRQSADVNAQTFDVEVSAGRSDDDKTPVKAAPVGKKSVPVPSADIEDDPPPF